MPTHRPISTWKHDGARYSVSVLLEEGKPQDIIFERVQGEETHCASLPADGATVENVSTPLSWSLRSLLLDRTSCERKNRAATSLR